jgi:hypothetical protein
MYIKIKNTVMSRLVIRMILLVAIIFVFGSFQYGGIDTPPPFANSWQSFSAAIAMVISGILVLMEIKHKIFSIHTKRF